MSKSKMAPIVAAMMAATMPVNAQLRQQPTPD